jgi:Uma2 family endonuclease
MVAMSFEMDAPVALTDFVVPAPDQCIVMHGVSWEHYEALLAQRGAKRRPRMTYLDGAVELISISKHHERVRFVLGRLLEIYMLELGVSFCGYGQATYKMHARSGFEADECYVLGEPREDRPDLVLEIVHKHGGLEKLEVYRAFGVPEVWICERGELRVFALRAGQYEAAARSRLLPEVELGLLASFVERAEGVDSDTLQAFRAALRGGWHEP